MTKGQLLYDKEYGRIETIIETTKNSFLSSKKRVTNKGVNSTNYYLDNIIGRDFYELKEYAVGDIVFDKSFSKIGEIIEVLDVVTKSYFKNSIKSYKVSWINDSDIIKKQLINLKINNEEIVEKLKSSGETIEESDNIYYANFDNKIIYKDNKKINWKVNSIVFILRNYFNDLNGDITKNDYKNWISKINS